MDKNAALNEHAEKEEQKRRFVKICEIVGSKVSNAQAKIKIMKRIKDCFDSKTASLNADFV